jgi:uncharacterized YigZ family protein
MGLNQDMSADTYYTIEHQEEGFYRELGSRFISFAVPVFSEEEVKTILEKFKKKYFDASHLCYAYIIGTEKKTFKAHDAGEPKHSAGDPILNQMKSFEITNVVVIVVRYFGGTKLGMSGLINAYKLAAKSVLEKAGRVEKILHVNLKIQFDPELTGEIMKLLGSNKSMILDSRFENSNVISLNIRTSQETKFRDLVEKVKGTRFI